jgi:hypothetical protein
MFCGRHGQHGELCNFLSLPLPLPSSLLLLLLLLLLFLLLPPSEVYDTEGRFVPEKFEELFRWEFQSEH